MPAAPKSGSKGLIIALIIIVIIIAGWFLFGRGGGAGMMGGLGEAPHTLTGLLGWGKSVMCEFSYEEEAVGAGKGMVYVADGKMRNDFSVTGPDGKMVEGHMISNGETNYIWSSEMPGQGIKMAMMDAEGGTGVPKENYQTVDWNKDYDYACKKWSADESMFAPPSDVQFMDMDEIMKNMMPANMDADMTIPAEMETVMEGQVPEMVDGEGMEAI
ncbi:hypothetical protein L0Y46_04345 [bacterium]|nr:hypothetical protein [bacterium]